MPQPAQTAEETPQITPAQEAPPTAKSALVEFLGVEEAREYGVEVPEEAAEETTEAQPAEEQAEAAQEAPSEPEKAPEKPSEPAPDPRKLVEEALAAQRQEFEQRFSQLQEQATGMDTWRKTQELIGKGDKLGALKALGLSKKELFDEMAQIAVKGQLEDDRPDPIKPVMGEVEQLKAKLEAMEQAQQQRESQLLEKETLTQAHSMLTESPTLLTRAKMFAEHIGQEPASLLVQAAHDLYQNTGKVPSWEDAREALDKQITDLIALAKKLEATDTTTQPANTTPAQPSSSTGQPPTAKPKTLSSAAASRAPARVTDEPEDDEERMERILARHKIMQ